MLASLDRGSTATDTVKITEESMGYRASSKAPSEAQAANREGKPVNKAVRFTNLLLHLSWQSDSIVLQLSYPNQCGPAEAQNYSALAGAHWTIGHSVQYFRVSPVLSAHTSCPFKDPHTSHQSLFSPGWTRFSRAATLPDCNLFT